MSVQPRGKWAPRYVVTKADGVGGKPILEDEPCLVIRAQDYLALAVMGFYIAEYAELSDATSQVLGDLVDHWDALRVWRLVNVSAIKVAGR